MLANCGKNTIGALWRLMILPLTHRALYASLALSSASATQNLMQHQTIVTASRVKNAALGVLKPCIFAASGD